ncbi:MAG: deoxyribodipyrimidine photo-lyase, partial [Actinobacteria bacterium]|nr:deoxyribodipyrimidine photo-lyase [Actinomycetota bacterium]
NDVMKRYKADSVHSAFPFAPYGEARDAELKAAGLEIQQLGSGYAVAPGRVRKDDGTPYRVYTPFYRAWLAHGWRAPVAAPKNPKWVTPKSEDQKIPNWKSPNGVVIQEAGEKAALARFKNFLKKAADDYGDARNIPGVEGTSRLSPHLRWGEIHPRTILAALGNSKGHEVYRKEIAWREFYADVLHHNPHTSRDYYDAKFKKMKYDKPSKQFEAWCKGQTGFPFVDAAMRQLVAEGWMHNRTRMVVASFLVKDLHIEWQHGANFFMKYLIDNDVASNSHGWQWTAGCGTDASPYYRVFNPIEQGKRFDPDGIYIKRFIPELSHLSGEDVHEPWEADDGYEKGYVKRIVDHAAERLESLARLEEIKAAKPLKP